MPTPLDGDLSDQLLSDPTFQAESPQREIIATLERLTDNWQQYVPRNDAEEVALSVLLNSNAAQIISLEAKRIPNARLTITGLRWKALLGNASDSERPKVVYMILKLAFESQPEPEPEVEVVEPPELIHLRQWLSLDGIKGYWQHTIAAAEFWRLEVDGRHKDIAFLLRQVIGGDPSEETIRDFLFQVHGLLPSAPVSLASLENLLRQDAAKIGRVDSASANIDTFILQTRVDLDELLKLGEQTTEDGTITLPLSGPRADGSTSSTIRLFAEPRASAIYKAFLSRLRNFDEELAINFETANEGKLKTANGLSLAIRRLLLEMKKPERQDGQSEKQVDSRMPPSVKPEAPPTDNSVETDDKLPKKLRKDSPSRVKAKAAHDYAIERIPNAQHMTIPELHAAILADPEVADMVPARADAFGTFLREAGVKRYKLKS